MKQRMPSCYKFENIGEGWVMGGSGRSSLEFFLKKWGTSFSPGPPYLYLYLYAITMRLLAITIWSCVIVL